MISSTKDCIASLAGKANSISTIFSLDIYKKYFNKTASERKLVLIGRWAVVISMGIAALVTPALRSLDQAYQFIQEYVGFISPGVLAIFLLGFFWKRTTAAAAMADAAAAAEPQPQVGVGGMCGGGERSGVCV